MEREHEREMHAGKLIPAIVVSLILRFRALVIIFFDMFIRVMSFYGID